ncbi:FeoB-associated Cys-rich membrane protein [Mycoplasmatota bacterium WC44]
MNNLLLMSSIDLVVGGILILVLSLITIKVIIDRKNGKVCGSCSSCGDFDEIIKSIRKKELGKDLDNQCHCND